MKILVTGGHPAPALAVIDYARSHRQFENVTFTFVGRKFNNQREESLSYEYKEITERGILFYHLTTGRVTRLFDLNSLKNLFYIPFGFYNAWRILSEVKPNRILTFGGYIALPIAYVASRMNIPVYVHEQTIAPGIATKKIGKIAKKIFLSFPDSQKGLDEDKCIVTGNLVREAVFEKSELSFPLPKNQPVLYITGGSLGSHSVNKHIEKLLPQLLKQFTVIHQTGNMKEYNDYQRLTQVRESLPEVLKSKYTILEHIPASQIGTIFQAADVIVSRSGANTVTELVALKKPSVLIPLPWSARGEQMLQAQLLEKAGVAEVFEQQSETSELYEKIQTVYNNREQMRAGFKSLAVLYNPNAPRTVLETVIQG